MLWQGESVKVKGNDVPNRQTTFDTSLIHLRRAADLQERGGVTDRGPRDQVVSLAITEM